MISSRTRNQEKSRKGIGLSWYNATNSEIKNDLLRMEHQTDNKCQTISELSRKCQFKGKTASKVTEREAVEGLRLLMSQRESQPTPLLRQNPVPSQRMQFYALFPAWVPWQHCTQVLCTASPSKRNSAIHITQSWNTNNLRQS